MRNLPFRIFCGLSLLLFLWLLPSAVIAQEENLSSAPAEPVLDSAAVPTPEKPPEPPAVPLQFQDLESALTRAANQGKQVIVLAHAGWSDHSRKLLDTWQSDPAVREFLAGFIPVILDADRDREQCLSLNLRAWPTTLVLQRDRMVLAELRGVRDPADYLAQLNGKLERYRKP